MERPSPVPLRPLGREERVEDLVANARGNAHAGVRDGDLHAAVGGGRPKRELAAGRHGVERIEDHVGQALAQLGRIAGDPGQRIGQIGGDLDVDAAAARLLPPRRLRGLERLTDHLVEVDGHCRVIAPDPREVLEPPHGQRAVERRALDHLDPLAQLGILEPLQQELGPAQDRGQHVVEVVGHAGGHLPHRAELLRTDQLVLRRRQLRVRARALLEEPRAPERERGQVRDAGEQALIAVREGSVEAPEHAARRASGFQLPAAPRANAGTPRSPRSVRRIGASTRRGSRPSGSGRPVSSTTPDSPAASSGNRRRLAVWRWPLTTRMTTSTSSLDSSWNSDQEVPDVEQSRDVLVDGIEQAFLVQLAGHRSRQLMEHGELFQAALVVAEQPGVVQRDSGLARDGFHEPHLAHRQRPGARPPDDAEATHDPILGDDRHEELRLMWTRLADLAGNPLVVHRVGRHDTASRPRGLRIERMLNDRDPQPARQGDQVRRDVVAREGLHPLAAVVHEPHPGAVGSEGVHDVSQELSRHGIEIQGGGESAAHGEQALGFFQLLLRLARQVGVLHRQADLDGHALDEADLGRLELLPRSPPDEEQRAHRFTAHHGRGEEHGVRIHAGEGLRIDARVALDVRGPERAAGPPDIVQHGEAPQHEGSRA